MRRTLATLLVAASAAVTLGAVAPSAMAVCGGGAPGEACYCPSTITVPVTGKHISTGITC